jgi:hypothetical protein
LWVGGALDVDGALDGAGFKVSAFEACEEGAFADLWDGAFADVWDGAFPDT